MSKPTFCYLFYWAGYPMLIIGELGLVLLDCWA